MPNTSNRFADDGDVREGGGQGFGSGCQCVEITLKAIFKK